MAGTALHYHLGISRALTEITSVTPTDRLIRRLRVLIVEDHRLVSEAVARSLADEPDIEVVGVAGSVKQAYERLHLTPVDVVLLDYHLPDGDGLVVARHILRDLPGIRIILVTAHEEREVLREAMEIGCIGFIGKSESWVHLPNAIRSAAGGTMALSPALAAKLLDRDGGAGGLTERETQILSLFAGGASTADVAEHLFITPHTLRNAVMRINAKLGTHSKLEAVAAALRDGIISVNRPAPRGPGPRRGRTR